MSCLQPIHNKMHGLKFPVFFLVGLAAGTLRSRAFYLLTLLLAVSYSKQGFGDVVAPAGQSNAVIVLRNVVIPALETGRETINVDIRLENGQLDIISEDRISREQHDLSLDAADGGMLLGKLTLGEPANFLILRGNPQDNLGVLLDTRRFTTFAVHEGVVAVNRIVDLEEEEHLEHIADGQGWMA